MDNNVFLELAVKYYLGECSKNEEQEMKKLLQARSYSEQYEKIKSQIEEYENSQKHMEFSVYDGFDKLSEKIKMYEPNFRENAKKDTLKEIIFTPVFLRTAASVAFVMIISTVILYSIGIFDQQTKLPAWNEKITELGERSILTFLDGTTITLNSGSRLKYPARFENDCREVFLEGEAYFDVKRDPNRPFIVHSENLSTTVLGTKFNVSAFPEEKTISVSLVEGKVKVVKNEKGKNDEMAVLEPKQQFRYDKKTNVSSFEKFDSLNVVGWIDNIFKFDDEPLGKVLSQFKRSFDVEFELADESLANRIISAKFENSSLWTVTEVIKKLTGLESKFIKENNEVKKIVFY